MSSSILYSVSTVDSSACIGRVDKASLTQQTLMELFIEGVYNKAVIFGSEDATEVSFWRGITMNGDLEVEKIVWTLFGLNGGISLEWLPDSVCIVAIRNTFITGTINLIRLSEKLESLNLSENLFVGSVNLECLPDCLKKLSVWKNKLSGEINLTKLPKGMRDLDLSRNRFSGQLDLTCLPGDLRTLILESNDFCGRTDFSHLPDSLAIFNVSHTRLEGEIRKTVGKRFYASKSDVIIITIFA